MGMFELGLALLMLTWVVLLAVLIVYYEVRRARRIRRNVPLEDVPFEPPGFEVELKEDT